MLVLNPNGKVSTCCAVANQKDDFAEYSRADGFFETWNSKKFKQARRLFTSRKPSASVKDAKQIAEPFPENDGKDGKVSGSRRSVSLPIFNGSQPIVAPSEDALICQACPIPYRMHEALDTVDNTAAALLSSFHQESSIWKKAHPLSAYLLMGMPGWKSLLRSVLSFRTRKLRGAARNIANGMLHGMSRAR